MRHRRLSFPPAGAEFIPLGLERFSPYFDDPDRYGLKITGPVRHYSHYPCAEADLWNLAYSFDYTKGCDSRRDVGVERLREVIVNWQRQESLARGSLLYRRGPGFLLITDQRPNTAACRYRLNEREAEIYLRCEDGARVIRSGGHLIAMPSRS